MLRWEVQSEVWDSLFLVAGEILFLLHYHQNQAGLIFYSPTMSVVLCCESRCGNEATYTAPTIPAFHHGPACMCEVHRMPGDVKLHKATTRCYVPWCTTRPVFGCTVMGTVACSIHVCTGMVNLTWRTCRTRGCTERATHGPVWFTAPLMCGEHSVDFMIDLLAPKNRCSLCGDALEVYAGWVLCSACLHSVI